MADTTGDSDESVPSWLQQAAHASLSGAPAVLTRGATLLGGRFTVERVLGEGGMGVVYAARDGERGQPVALKTLAHDRPDAIYRIKQEFRALADVRHENLVQLHDLFEDQGRWCFTMELVEGRTLTDALRAPSPAASRREGDRGDGRRAPPPSPSQREGDLRDAFAQLAAGIEAIHRAGKLHRDLKPSNVLVTPEGRVVVLDFGLAADVELGGVGQTVADGAVSGTPAYMAPEQASGRGAGEASDWYALGVMLYEALAGRLPFEGRAGEMLAMKQTRDPAPPSAHGGDVDAELEALCMALLSREPAARPGADAVRAALRTGRAAGAHAESPPIAAAVDEAPFVGRRRELEALRQAYRATDEGRPLRMLVGGPSGVGKSTLVEHFLGELEDYGEAVVLTGRCYEREAVPYKAFDGVIDALSRHLRKLPPAAAMALVPPGVQALGKLFPAIGRLEVATKVRRRAPPPQDPAALRTAAFAALRELLSRLSETQPLVLYVDDLQWGDADSARLMAELLAPPAPPALLLVGTFRADEREGSAFFQALARFDEGDPVLPRRELSLENLGVDDARTLATALGAPAATIDAIADESGGHPLFVRALARSAGRGASLEAVIGDELDALDPGPRRLVELSALCGRPLTRALLITAVDRADADNAALDALFARQLLRTIAGEGPTRVACYHDRIREVAAARLSADARRAAHRALLGALEAAGDAEPESLVEHLLGAGDTARGAALAASAAAEVGARGAFAESARLYEVALEHGDHGDEQGRELHTALSEARMRAGQVEQAAAALEAAAELADADAGDNLRLRGLALRIVYTRNGDLTDDARPLLERVGLDFHAADLTQRSVAKLEDLITHHLDFEPRPRQELDRALVVRLAAVGELARALAYVFHFGKLLCTMARGVELSVQARGISASYLDAVDIVLSPDILKFAGYAGSPDALQAVRERAREFSQRYAALDADDEARNDRAAAEAEEAGDIATVLSLREEALSRLEARGWSPQLERARNSLQMVWDQTGQIGRGARILGWIREHAGEGRPISPFWYHLSTLYLIARDDAEAALGYLEAAGVEYPWWGSGAVFNAHTYLGRHDEARARLEAFASHGPEDSNGTWERLQCETHMVLALRGIELEENVARARQALAQCRIETFKDRQEPLRDLTAAALAHLSGAPEEARSRLSALAGTDPWKRNVARWVALRRLGELEGGAGGAARVDEADRFLRDQGVLDPARFVAALSPGFGLPQIP